MPDTKIEWADGALNFYDWHCTMVSPGCKFCYAKRHAEEHNKPAFLGSPPSWRPNALLELKKTAPGSVLFINTHSDTYHEKMATKYIQTIHDCAVQRPDIIFLLLTKRPARPLTEYMDLKWPENLWLGTSVESNDYLGRIDTLKAVPAAHRFLSIEPLLEPLSRIDLTRKIKTDIDWVIVGGESGEFFRPFQHEWAVEIRDICKLHKIPFFFKQGAGLYPGMNRELEGRIYEERPPEFQALHDKYTVRVTQQSLF